MVEGLVEDPGCAGDVVQALVIANQLVFAESGAVDRGLSSSAREVVLVDVRFEGNTSEAGEAAHAAFSSWAEDGVVRVERVVFGAASGPEVELGRDRSRPRVIVKETKWPLPL